MNLSENRFPLFGIMRKRKAPPAGRERRFRKYALARRQQHDHLPAFEPRLRFDLGDRPGVHFHAVE